MVHTKPFISVDAMHITCRLWLPHIKYLDSVKTWKKWKWSDDKNISRYIKIKRWTDNAYSLQLVPQLQGFTKLLFSKLVFLSAAGGGERQQGYRRQRDRDGGPVFATKISFNKTVFKAAEFMIFWSLLKLFWSFANVIELLKVYFTILSLNL